MVFHVSSTTPLSARTDLSVDVTVIVTVLLLSHPTPTFPSYTYFPILHLLSHPTPTFPSYTYFPILHLLSLCFQNSLLSVALKMSSFSKVIRVYTCCPIKTFSFCYINSFKTFFLWRPYTSLSQPHTFPQVT